MKAQRAILARGRVIQQMRQAGATNQSIQEYIKAEAARDKAKMETLAPPQPSEQSAAYADQVPGAKVYGVLGIRRSVYVD